MSNLPEDTRSHCTLAFVVASIFVGATAFIGTMSVISMAMGIQILPWLNVHIFEFTADTLTATARLLGALYLFIICGISFLIFLSVARLFYGLRSGPVFSKGLPINVRRLGRSILWMGFFALATPFARASLDAINGGSADITVGANSGVVLVFLFGFTLTTLARVLHDAVEIELENRQFI